MTGFAMIMTTVGNEAEARDLARVLVEARLCACVQIMPISSVYRWEGRVEEASEHLLLCKVVAVDFASVSDAIRRRHSYDEPEIVMVPFVEGHVPYLDWITASTRRS